jgi:hypothetical protein
VLLLARRWPTGPVEDCNQVRDLKRQLRGCTAYIKQGKAAPANLATAYINRANIYAQRRKYKLAFADYASAIAQDPRNPLIPYNRGNAYLETRRYQLAADYAGHKADAGSPSPASTVASRMSRGTPERRLRTTGEHSLSTRRQAPQKR